MRQQIQELIEHHKLSKLECLEMLKGLQEISQEKINKTDKSALQKTVDKYTQEIELRLVFINQLENLL